MKRVSIISKQFGTRTFPYDEDARRVLSLILIRNPMKFRFYLGEFKSMCTLVNRDLRENA